MNENIIRTDYAELMQKSYIDYAMSVIVSRALPDVRDGLKPVQRRTLYDMHELGIRYDRPYRKCARIVGDTMGKYHPHGDSSIYEALVVMSQDFKKGLPLVDGHGNFGSIEGDGPAAMRYTEARLQKITQEVYLGDLDKNVVDFVPNFDETEKEPSVLPVRIPNLLINGADGIAVGMATSIPPHNLGEVIDGVKAYMKNNDITVRGLMRYIKGPDFPTGGIVVNQDDLRKIYETGSGKIRVRGKVELEKAKGGRLHLVITEIPYPMLGANIGKFLNDVANLVETKKTTDIVDISNQSSKEGIRIVLELKKDTDVENLTNMLYKKTRLEDTFGVNMLAVAQGRPETLNLKQIIEHHVDFQFEITTRKYKTLLEKELEKKEIQEGLIKACDVIDLIIEILRGSQNQAQVKNCLVNGVTEGIRFKSKASEKQAARLAFTERQATAILEMRLYRLIGLEIQALEKEHEKTLKNIAEYEDILNNYDSMAGVIIRDLDAIKKEYGKKRRTAIENAEEAVYEEKKTEAMEVWFLMDRFGYVKTVDKTIYERNQEAITREYRHVFPVMNTDRICVFTDTGKMHVVKVMDIPLGKFRDKGTPLDNLSNFSSQEERMLYVASMTEVLESQFLFVTEQSMMKLVDGTEFDVATRKTIDATKLNSGDRLLFVGRCDSMEYVVLQSREGFFLRFLQQEVPVKKKNAIGVRGMRLGEGDALEQAYLLEAHTEYTIPYGEKKISLNRLKLAKRDTKGSKSRG
ncbi:MAG TPA: DNA topoisomerase 4 subunit A [Candidatus Blautia gallistercoris]|uniref:DNA topoisomerase (ATP-hydrolyzing) n=1 Tax=Candidatus Blautia gallistercoris TaxID=2838490 RepID=A0A9D1WKC9_9FIRM|nr:DNA topoisomerase 4 subunit A [Candidatus Blautia gallistercoris]